MSAVALDKQGKVAVIAIDNPPVNAVSRAVREGLIDALQRAESDPAIEAVVIGCTGRTFIAGADIREFGQPPQAPLLPEVVERIEACTKPVIAALHGTALGGGMEIALGCHYRIARKDASMGFPEVTLGLLPGATGTQRLPRVAGVERALEMMISGRPVKAPAALDAGIIDAVSTEDDILGAAVNYAENLIAGGAAPRRIRDLETAPVPPQFFADYRKKMARKTRGLPAPERIVRCVELAASAPYDEAIAREREYFLECKASPQSAALRHAFFAERQVSKVPGIGKETPRRNIHTVAIIGAGTMGAAIAYACLGAGFNVLLLDNDAAGLERGEATINRLYEGGIKRGRITSADMADGLSRFTATRDYADLAEADLAIEAAFENMAVKKEVFAKLDSTCKPGAILATNTSTLDVDEIANATQRPGDVIGLHFFSPAHIMRLVEIVRGAATEPEVIATSLGLAKSLGKIGTVVGNCFGFVGNRMLYSYGRENQLLLLEGAAPEFIDATLFDWGMAMGPNAVGDLAGLDVGYKVRQERTDLPDDPRFYRMADVLAKMGRYGQKTGKGMFRYEPGSREPVPDPEVQALIRQEARRLGIEQRDIGAQEIIERCIYGLVVEGTRILEDGVANRPGDIDVIWINGYGFPRHRGGPMHYADSVGLDRVYATVCEFRERFGPLYWEPPLLLRELAQSGRTFAEWQMPAGQ